MPDDVRSPLLDIRAVAFVASASPWLVVTSVSCLLLSHRYYTQKRDVLQEVGFGPSERFPVYGDRFPIQLLAYLRLSRIQDPLLFTKVSVVPSPARHGESNPPVLVPNMLQP